MRAKLLLAAWLLLPLPAWADFAHGEDAHGASHAFHLDADAGAGRESPIFHWHFDGWLGDHQHKLWLKSEGESHSGEMERAEFWALYSRNIAQLWDAQIGYRQDVEHKAAGYLTMGLVGLLPWHIETEAHFFVSHKGDTSARVRLERDVPLTEQWILQPYAELNAAFQHVPEAHVGSGLTRSEAGLQLRHQITPNFAPYFDLRAENTYGETADLHKEDGEHTKDVIIGVGVRLVF